jgi:hypothetical protein
MRACMTNLTTQAAKVKAKDQRAVHVVTPAAAPVQQAKSAGLVSEMLRVIVRAAYVLNGIAMVRAGTSGVCGAGGGRNVSHSRADARRHVSGVRVKCERRSVVTVCGAGVVPGINMRVAYSW